MYHTVNMVVSPNTQERAPATATLKLTRGKITAIQVGFPRGCYQLVHVQIYHGGWQICPWSRASDLAYEDYVYDMTYDYPMDIEPFILTMRGWSEDETFKHKIMLGVEFVPYTPTDYLRDIMQSMRELAETWRT